ncbi:hypothetical protein D9M68_829290 [compost metagenome]
MAARKADIAAAFPSHHVHASMASMKRESRNVPSLAAHFGVGVDIVQDLYSFGVSFSENHFVGWRDTAVMSSFMDAEVILPGRKQP